MSEKIKVGLIIAVVEAILALGVGYLLFMAQKDTIERKTVDTLAGYFESVDEDMSYDQVMEFLYEDSQRKDKELLALKQDNETLQNELSLLKDQVSSDETNSTTVMSAQSFAESERYEMALAILNSVTNKTPQMEILANDYAKLYEAQIIAKADALVNEEKYEEAIEIIEGGLKQIQNSAILKDKKDKIMNSKPQPLLNAVQPYETKYYTVAMSEMAGEKYYNGFQLGGSGFALFNLNGQYTRISGVIGHVDGSGNYNKTVTIYADDVLIETIDVGFESLPKEFTFDVSGVKQLKFEREGGSSKTGLGSLIVS